MSVATTGEVLRLPDGTYEHNGRKLPSVSSILQTAEALGLDTGIGYVFSTWTADEADRIIGAALSGDPFMRPAGVSFDSGRPVRIAEPIDVAEWHSSGEAKKHLSRVARRNLDMAADRGTIVHHAVGHLARGDSVTGADILSQYSEGLFPDDKAEGCIDALAAWWACHDIQVAATEISGINLEYGYAGTLDMFAKIDGETYLVDFKTSASWRLSHMLQVAAYRKFEAWLERSDGGIVTVPVPNGAEHVPTLVVLVGEDSVSCYRVEPEQADKFFVMFKKLLDLKLGWRQKGKAKRVTELDWRLFA